MLQVNNIEVIYSDVILVLKGLSLVVPQGQIVALLGSHGGGSGGGDPARRGALAKRRENREGGLRTGLRVLPTPQGAPEAAGGVPLRGGAADARDREVPDGAGEADAVRPGVA